MILFVGDRPSKRTDPNIPFRGAACEMRLHEWINYVLRTPDEVAAIVNSDNEFSIGYNLKLAGAYRVPVVALGNNASKVLTRLGVNHFKLPHPSGRNRQINNKKFINQKLAECREWLAGVSEYA